MRRIASIVSIASRRRSSSPVRERERERVEDEVGGLDAVLARSRCRRCACATRSFHSAVARLALFVDREADHRGAVFACEAEHAVHALALALALFEVGGVEDRLAAVVLEPGFDHLRARSSRTRAAATPGSRTAPAISSMSSGAVAADVVDAHVEHVRAFLHLLARHLHARVPVGFEHRVAELARAVGVGALADREVRELLVERHVRVDRRAAGLGLGRRARPARGRCRAGRRPRRRCSGVVPQQPPTMLRPNSCDEALVRVGERRRA